MALSVVILFADFASGPSVQFPILLVLPVVLAGWYSGAKWAIGLGATLPLARILFHLVWDEPFTWPLVMFNTVVRVGVLGGIAFLVSRTAAQIRELRILRGLVPICSHCKKIRNDDEVWIPIEQYVSDRSEASFSHAICPECLEAYYGAVGREVKEGLARKAEKRGA